MNTNAKAKLAEAGQTRFGSASESVVNVFVGYVVAIATQAVAYPFFGIEATMSDQLGIAAIFTIVSLARSYLLRRAFNKWGKK